MKKIKYKNFLLIRDLFLAIFGGFVGAVFGIISLNLMGWKQATSMIFSYMVLIFLAILLLRFFSEEK